MDDEADAIHGVNVPDRLAQDSFVDGEVLFEVFNSK
jgi:hypothetical protein